MRSYHATRERACNTHAAYRRLRPYPTARRSACKSFITCASRVSSYTSCAPTSSVYPTSDASSTTPPTRAQVFLCSRSRHKNSHRTINTTASLELICFRVSSLKRGEKGGARQEDNKRESWATRTCTLHTCIIIAGGVASPPPPASSSQRLTNKQLFFPRKKNDPSPINKTCFSFFFFWREVRLSPCTAAKMIPHKLQGFSPKKIVGGVQGGSRLPHRTPHDLFFHQSRPKMRSQLRTDF